MCDSKTFTQQHSQGGLQLQSTRSVKKKKKKVDRSVLVPRHKKSKKIKGNSNK